MCHYAASTRLLIAAAFVACASVYSTGLLYSEADPDARTLHQSAEYSKYGNASRPCPCKIAKYCNRVARLPKKEVFVFSVNSHNWLKYDWTKVTSVVEFGYHDDDLVCYAHSKGARVLINANIAVADLVNVTARQIWIEKQTSAVANYFVDGINVDFESPIAADRDDLRRGLADYIAHLKAAFEQQSPAPLITFDVAWSSHGVDGRYYDYKGIADASNLLFVMAYDQRSQIFGDCIAWANSAYNNTSYGLSRYLHIGVPASKLVLGVPWYGYHYPCVAYDTVSQRCSLRHIPFRGVNCSDLAGKEMDYGIIVNKHLPKSFTGRLWDNVARSPYFSVHESDGDQVVQVWYDDPESLGMKYKLVNDLDLAGLGMWTGDSIDYNDRKMVSSMWGAIPRLN